MLGALRCALKSAKILEFDYGHFITARRRSCVDRNGNPIPWYTYPAIEYLIQLDYTDKTVFEYGSGNSTLFWAERARKVVSVEDNHHWYSRIGKEIGKNIDLRLISDRDEYIRAIGSCDEKFWVIVIDGSHRYECAKQAITRLKPGGMIILDNSDWFTETAALLRHADLIEIDMSGFGPINAYTWTTSLFVHRQFRLRHKGKNQPQRSIGGLSQKRD